MLLLSLAFIPPFFRPFSVRLRYRIPVFPKGRGERSITERRRVCDSLNDWFGTLTEGIFHVAVCTRPFLTCCSPLTSRGSWGEEMRDLATLPRSEVPVAHFAIWFMAGFGCCQGESLIIIFFSFRIFSSFAFFVICWCCCYCCCLFSLHLYLSFYYTEIRYPKTSMNSLERRK